MRAHHYVLLGLGILLAAPRPAAASSPYGLPAPPPMGAFLDGRMPELGPGVSGNWSTVVAFPQLAFQNALGLTPFPGSTRLVVWEREGRVWSFENRPDVAEKKLVLDLSRECQGWDDSGLLGFAFHPNFAANHFVYAWFNWVEPGTVVGDPNHRPPTDKPNHARLVRYTLDAEGVAIPSSALVLIDQLKHTVWHTGGGMFFHPRNGFLYLTQGDDETNDAQRIDQGLFGGVLRIDVDQRGGSVSHPIPRQPLNGHTANYFIPDDNPFVGRADALEEFLALGLRSPHRMTYDPPSGRIYIGDVGASEREEIDVIDPHDPPGLNFQWPRLEGLRGDLTPPFIGVNRRPIIDYTHGEGNAVIGGYVYRGKKWADDLGGRYLFGDNGTGKIWVLDERSVPPVKMQLATLPFGPGPNTGSNYTGLSSFGLDQENELYLCQMSSEAGHIYRLERTGPPPARKPFPKLLSQTGAFTDTARLVAAPGLIPYTVISPLWSDGAVKSRWMALPPGRPIEYADKGDWKFPEGTVLVKHFELPVDEKHPEVHRRLETRLLVLDRSGTAYGVTYKWRPDGTDAELLPDGLTERIAIRTADGGVRTQDWSYPSQAECTRCHTPAANFVLGPKTRQLNVEVTYPATGVKDNQLRAWNHLGLFRPALDEAKLPGLDRLVPPSDPTAALEARARSYLDANCAHCHRPGGVQALWDARFDTALASARIVNSPALNRLDVAGARIVRPGEPDLSILLRRVTSLDPAIKMPPLARNTVDARAVATLHDWIVGLPMPLDALPRPWRADDIGATGLPGESHIAEGVFTVIGGGADIWDRSDAFQYLYQPLRGDGQIVARVTAVGNSDAWAKAGVMIRGDLKDNSPHAFCLLTFSQGVAFQRRATAAGESEHTGGPESKFPLWVKLERRGRLFRSAVSSDGVAWKQVGEQEIEMGPDVFAGLAVTAHNNSASCTATFDHVSVTGSGPPAP
jgi:uncharacterized repeat protein (TIGR03806 family)